LHLSVLTSVNLFVKIPVNGYIRFPFPTTWLNMSLRLYYCSSLPHQAKNLIFTFQRLTTHFITSAIFLPTCKQCEMLRCVFITFLITITRHFIQSGGGGLKGARTEDCRQLGL
jgi:hypothetical protein